MCDICADIRKGKYAQRCLVLVYALRQTSSSLQRTRLRVSIYGLGISSELSDELNQLFKLSSFLVKGFQISGARKSLLSTTLHAINATTLATVDDTVCCRFRYSCQHRLLLVTVRYCKHMKQRLSACMQEMTLIFVNHKNAYNS
jgi:hypothetical protein